VKEKESFGEHIRKWRHEKDWTVKNLLQAIEKREGRKLSPAYITRIEQYGEIPSPDVICILAGVFGRDPEELLELAKDAKVRRFGENIDAKYSEAVGLYRMSRRKRKSGG